MGRDGICRVQGKTYSKCIRFYDINYQLAQNEDKNAIFENWCDFLNYFDASIHFQLSFINHKSSMKEFEQVIRIRPQDDTFDDVRMEYAKMLKQQLAKGNNGLVKSKYITFSIEADNIREAKPKLERIESDILNNFKILGVPAYPLNGVERLQILYETSVGCMYSRCNVPCVIGSEIYHSQENALNRQFPVQSLLYCKNCLNQLLKSFNRQICSLYRYQHRIGRDQCIDCHHTKTWHTVNQDIIVSGSYRIDIFLHDHVPAHNISHRYFQGRKLNICRKKIYIFLVM